MKKNSLLCLLMIICNMTGYGGNLYDKNDSIYLALDSLYKFYYPEWSAKIRSNGIPLTERIHFRDLCSKELKETNIKDVTSKFGAYYVSYHGVDDGRDFILLKIDRVFSLYDWEDEKIAVLKSVNQILHQRKLLLSKERWDNLINNLLTFRDRSYYPIRDKIYNLQIHFNVKK